MKTKECILLVFLIILLCFTGCKKNKEKTLKGLKKNLNASGYKGTFFSIPKILF